MPTQFQTEVTQLTTCDSGRRNPATCQVVVVHTYECPRGDDVEERAAWQDRSRTGSYNILVGTRRRLRANDDNYIPWAAFPTGNRIGLHLCILAYAAESRNRWLEYDHQLTLAAEVAADWCTRYNIPPVKLTAAEVRAGKRGICGHGEISGAFHESDHTDPGPGFPWDVFIQKVKTIMAGDTKPKPEVKEFSMQAEKEIGQILNQLVGPGRDKKGDTVYGGWDEASIIKNAKTRKGGGVTLVELAALNREELGALHTRVDEQTAAIEKLAGAVQAVATALDKKETPNA